jgi:DNA-binding MarR family transcriptional regulator
MAKPVNMSALAPSASPLFLREPEVRRGVELLYFGYNHYLKSVDEELGRSGLGRAHHRALYFISRRPGLTVSDLLAILAITKQSLGRVLNDLSERQLVETRPGERDRRQRLLFCTEAGIQLEMEFFEAGRRRMSEAYARAGQSAVSGFWAVLEGLMSDETRELFQQLER